MRDDTQLDNWVAFLYFQRGTVMLYSGMEYAPKERVDFFENQSNYGDMQRDMQLYLRKLKELKQTAAPSPAAIGWRRETACCWDITRARRARRWAYSTCADREPADVAVELPDGDYPNRLGGSVTVKNGRLAFDGKPVAI